MKNGNVCFITFILLQTYTLCLIVQQKTDRRQDYCVANGEAVYVWKGLSNSEKLDQPGEKGVYTYLAFPTHAFCDNRLTGTDDSMFVCCVWFDWAAVVDGDLL